MKKTKKMLCIDTVKKLP
ncbi:hypothetical protein Ahy_A06g030404 isoform E [Arachis hypogaea]|uniref:Uncharacterized protein n=1 Tax=Arachis hypogaea TaxID=3818 RepID=A0A444YUY1_ARAHY|nr:hypothetical protein Ahy_B06g085558 isoform F [Arachis hypogaea]RYR55161.1 hypothetical protein Ahy_A06g030404 isoform E [Arachis hypogaea]